MPVQITVSDQSLSGEVQGSLRLDLLTTRITLRELIRRRVYEEVLDFNARRNDTGTPLVEISEVEATLNGRGSISRSLDWQKQVALAVKAFKDNRYFVLVNDRQVDDLDAEIDLKFNTQVAFVRLPQLVGG